MDPRPTTSQGLYALGGWAGMLAGICILTLAVTATTHGMFFVAGAIQGGPVDDWIANVRANPGLSHVILALGVLGFAGMMLVALSLHRLIAVNDWRKTLALGGYLIGVPVVVTGMVEQLSLMNQVVFLAERMPESAATILTHVSFRIMHWELLNVYIGPFFIIVIGHTLMASSAHRAGILPRWMVIWALVNACCLVASFLFPFIPALEVLGFAAPSSMIWLIVLGVRLLRRAGA